jgi:hypothetical protein
MRAAKARSSAPITSPYIKGALLRTHNVAIYKCRPGRGVPEPALHKVWRYIGLERTHPKPCRRPFGIAGAPMIRAIAITAFTYRHPVVRLRVQSRRVESRGSRCAIRSLNARLSRRSKSGGSGTCLMTPRLRRFRSLDACDAAIDVDRRRRQRQHFRDARAAPSKGQAEKAYRRRHALRRFDKAAVLGGVEIFAATGGTKQILAIVRAARASKPRLKQNGRFCFSRRGISKLQRTCAQPCRCHADFSVLHGSFSDSKIMQLFAGLVARPERFELPTPPIRGLCFPVVRKTNCLSRPINKMRRFMMPPRNDVTRPAAGRETAPARRRVRLYARRSLPS